MTDSVKGPLAPQTGTLRSRTARLAGLRRLGGRLRKDEDGIAAIEFAILSLPFLTLLFGILELAIVFFASAALDHGTQQAARLVRTNQIDSNLSEAERKSEFRKAICENMAVFRDCETRLIVDLAADPNSFSNATLPAPSPYDPDFDRAAYDASQQPGGPAYTGPKPPAEQFDSADADATVILRAQYVHQLALPGVMTRLSNDANNTRRLTSITAFKNEPF